MTAIIFKDNDMFVDGVWVKGYRKSIKKSIKKRVKEKESQKK